MVVFKKAVSYWHKDRKSESQERVLTMKQPQRWIVLFFIAALALTKPLLSHALAPGVWKGSDETLLQTLHDGSLHSQSCKDFLVEIRESLLMSFQCDGKTQVKRAPLRKSAIRTVKTGKSHITITEFAFQHKKVRVGRLEQDLLKIPYVKEVIHASLQSDGSLAIHWESFEIDRFGRIVQSDLYKAFGLKTNISQVAKSLKSQNQ